MQWFEDDFFWKELFLYLYHERCDLARGEVEKILQLGQYNGGPLLDLGCGPGFHVAEFAQRGGEVCGVDLSPFYMEKAKNHIQEKGVQVRLAQCDMMNYVEEGKYELIVSLFTSFGYYATRQEDKELLKKMQKNLKPGGKILIDVMGKEILWRRLLAVSRRELPDGSMFFEWFEPYQDWSRLKSNLIKVHEGKSSSFEYHINLYSAFELKSLLQSLGFSRVDCYGSLEGAPYDEHASRLIVLAQ